MPEKRLRFLADASILLAGSLGIRETLTQLVAAIALTGYGQAADRERALAAGFDRHLVKPVTVSAIRAVLDAAVSGIPAQP